jgi:hypothetical protein
MTNEQINIAIAELCGWTEISHYTQAVDGWYGYEPEDGPHSQVPDFCNDLNAMHEAEKILVGRNNWELCDYVQRLHTVTNSWIAFATSHQRAEAFLKTLGKWEE